MQSNAIITAASLGDDKAIQQQLENLSREQAIELLNQQDAKGDSALHYAVTAGHLSTVKLLLDNGASPDISGSFGETPLHRAAKNNYAEIAECLLNANAKEDLRRQDGAMPIHVAAMEGSADAVEAFFKHDPAQLKLVWKEGRTPFFCAVLNGQTNVLKVLVENCGDDINQQNTYDGRKTALHIAAIRNKPELVSFLVDLKADVTKMDGSQWTPLQRAAMQPVPSAETAKILLTKNGKGIEDRPSPLILLAEHGDQRSPKVVEFARVLIEYGANPSAVNKEELTAFEILENQDLNENELGMYNLLSQYQDLAQNENKLNI